MVAIFCLRLAAGMLGCLLLLSGAQVNPRFFRTHFLTALGLIAGAGFFVRDSDELFLWLALAAGFLFCFLGAIVWHVEGSPGGRAIIFLAAAGLVAGLLLAPTGTPPDSTWMWTDHLTSAALLGAATTAMLLGHSYLIAPAMSIQPLRHMLVALGVSLGIRMVLTGVGLWLWTGRASTGNLELLLWLSVRWGIGFLGPMVLGWMVWETVKIRSTQSATGILYVVVILCFLGELTSQLLVEKTGYML